jgi:hypothetical protein
MRTMKIYQRNMKFFNDRRFLGIAALFSGAALLAHILTNISLRWGLVLTALTVLIALFIIWKRSSPQDRKINTRIAIVGITVGITATIFYDAAKYFLSQFDPSPYNPYEAIRVFGVLLAGEDASPMTHKVVGTLFHFLNGTCFGIAYAYFFRKPSLVSGILWGVFLETFQLTLYPGWLDVRFYREFVQISFISHVIYGAILGIGTKYGLRKMDVLE